MSNQSENPFKWRHFQSDIILLCVRWYLRYSFKVKKEWVYLYRAVDSGGNTLEFFLSPTRDAGAAKRFFLKMLAASHMMRKGQLQGMEKGNVEAQVTFVAKLFDMAA
jgi:transposase-like protein